MEYQQRINLAPLLDYPLEAEPSHSLEEISSSTFLNIYLGDYSEILVCYRTCASLIAIL